MGRFRVPAIRRIASNCRELLHVDRPLVALKFKVGGRDLFVAGEQLVDVNRHRGSQAWDAVLGPFLAELDYRDGVASAWWPLGREGHVVIAPTHGFGRPVVSDTGVRTEIIRELFESGDPIQAIARDFEIAPWQVEAALRYELRAA